MRKTLGGLTAVVVGIAVALFVRDRRAPEKHAGAPPPSASEKAKLDLRVPSATPTNRQWARDVDPDGPLRLEGQVVDDGGAGVGGATVWLSSVPPRSATTEADGTFAFEKVVGREYELTATAGARTGGPVSYRLTDKSDPVVIRVAQGAKVAVEVTNENGEPIENATVKLADFGETTASTGKDGTATLSPVRPGWVAVEVTAPGYAGASSFGQVGSGGATATIHVKLHKGVQVSGRVVDESGKALAKVHVTVGEAWFMPMKSAEATTDDKGDFTFAAVAPGSHTFNAADGEHAPAKSLPVTVSDHAVSGIAITMKEGGTISGKVVDAKGAAVPYANVRIAPKSESAGMEQMTQGRQAVADDKGVFEVRGLPRTKLQARATSSDASSKAVDLDLTAKPAAKDVSLVLDEVGTIAGTVVDDNGKPIAEVQVTALPDWFAAEQPTLAGLTSATTDGAGAFTIRGLPDGSYRLSASRSGGGRGFERGGTQAKVGDKAVKIVLPAPATLVGKVALEGGSAPKLANIQLGWHPATPAAPDGTFKIEDLEPGSYDVHIRGLEFAQFTHTDVKLEAGKTTDLGTITVARGRKLVGKVVDASGSPVAGARVTVSKTLFTLEGADDQAESFAEMSGARTTTTDQNGDFTVIGIAKTHAYAGAEHPDKGRATPIDVPEGSDDPAPVTIALRGFGSVTGKVTQKGEPQGGVTITDTTKGSLAQVAVTRTAEDGTFTFAKVAEGTHVFNAMQMKGMSANSTSATVEVTAGKQSNVVIDIPVGNITVAVTIKPLAGAKLDAAQVFLFRGQVAATTAKQLNDTFGSGGMQGMKFWFGVGKPMPTFEELVPGDYSVCGLPITGSLMDPTFTQRLQEHVDILRVYCKPMALQPSPQTQSIELDLPAMTPLPDPKT